MGDPGSFEIVTVADFAKVPPRRLRACLKEFAVAVEMARASEKLLQLCQRELENRGDIPKGDPGQWPMKTFIWTDDKAKTATLKIRIDGGAEPIQEGADGTD